MTLGLGIGLSDAWRLDSGGFFPGATLDMSFTSGRYLGATPASLSVTRASTAYEDDASGNWTSFASNVARITNKGLLIEESRTNSIRNNTMQGAAAGTPGTLPTNWSSSVVTSLTHSVIGSGTQNGIDYIDFRVFGTPGATGTGSFQFDTNTGIAATTGQTFAQSVFVALVGGSLTGLAAGGIQLGGIERNSGGGLLLAFSLLQITPTATFTRFSTTRTIADATAAFYNPNIRYNTTNGVAVDFTIRVGWPQLELGAFATSPIPTTSAAVTRAADAITLASVAWLTSQAPMSLYAETNVPQTNTGVAYRAVEIDNGTNTARISQSGGNWLGIYNTNGSGTASAVAADTIQKTAMAMAANDLAVVTNGGTVGTDATVTALAGLNRVTFGASTLTASVPLNGYLRRVAYFPTRLDNATLQSITT